MLESAHLDRKQDTLLVYTGEMGEVGELLHEIQEQMAALQKSVHKLSMAV